MIRILHVVSIMHRGGVETMLMNYYRNIDRNCVQFDFVEHGFEHNDYDDEIISLGGKIYNIPPKSEGVMKSLHTIENIIRNEPYDIVHVHMDAMNSFALYAAKKGGARWRISHAHSSSMPPNPIKDILYKLSIRALPRYANCYYSCSKISADYLYQHVKGSVGIEYIHNAIDVDKFSYQQNIRDCIRGELKAENRYIIGHVGNFQYPKNHMFLLEVLKEYIKTDPNVFLLLCGEGDLRASIETKIEEYHLKSNVVLLGVCNHVQDYMQAFDIQLHPSFYEGFPVVTIEAQCSGLPLIVSDTITKEIALSNRVVFAPIKGEEAVSTWVSEIEAFRKLYEKRVDQSELLRNKGYDIKLEAKKLQHKYEQLMERETI